MVEVSKVSPRASTPSNQASRAAAPVLRRFSLRSSRSSRNPWFGAAVTRSASASRVSSGLPTLSCRASRQARCRRAAAAPNGNRNIAAASPARTSRRAWARERVTCTRGHLARCRSACASSCASARRTTWSCFDSSKPGPHCIHMACRAVWQLAISVSAALDALTRRCPAFMLPRWPTPGATWAGGSRRRVPAHASPRCQALPIP